MQSRDFGKAQIRLHHHEQNRVVAPSDPSAPVHRQQDRFDFIAGEEADHLTTMSFPWDG